MSTDIPIASIYKQLATDTPITDDGTLVDDVVLVDDPVALVGGQTTIHEGLQTHTSTTVPRLVLRIDG